MKHKNITGHFITCFLFIIILFSTSPSSGNPSEKLLFEDDLVWIPKEGEIKKAGKRQAGLYHAVQDRGLDVTTIVQSWPVADYGVKTVIPFEDLEKSMKVK